MKTTPQLDAHAKRAREYFAKVDRLEDEVDDSRIKAGLELIAARRLVDAGETDLTWTDWCAYCIKRSARDIRRVMALARADDPAQAHEDEQARNRAAKLAGSRATSPLRASSPRTGASPPAAPKPPSQAIRPSSVGLRQEIEKNWLLLSPSDQASLINWLIEHTANPPESAPTQGPHPPKAAPLASRLAQEGLLADREAANPGLRRGRLWRPGDGCARWRTLAFTAPPAKSQPNG